MRELSGVSFTRELIHSRGLRPMTSSLPKAPPPNTITLGNSISTAEFGRGRGHKHSVYCTVIPSWYWGWSPQAGPQALQGAGFQLGLPNGQCIWAAVSFNRFQGLQFPAGGAGPGFGNHCFRPAFHPEGAYCFWRLCSALPSHPTLAV